ncbi:DUF2141 domain-containing protein [Sphingomonas sp. NPDC019816]|uniref:DUF2141 domain-containing protein n=1 Tax=Sphingomonas sp. NPDC019816 TaxID=3390679 RepID=UPI003D07B5BD
MARAAWRGRRGASVLLVLAALPLIGAAPVSRLDIGIEQLRSAKGMVRLCLTADPDNFPACVDDARALTRSVPAGQHGLRVDGLPHGQYAAAVIHDENNNAKLDTLAGIPREGFGFSRNPAIRFGPPRFKAARFALDSVAETQQIRMRYIF